MVYKTNITQKGQLTIPILIRKQLKLKPKMQVVVWLDNESLKIKPAQTILDLAGTFKPKKAVSAVSLREKMAQDYGQR